MTDKDLLHWAADFRGEMLEGRSPDSMCFLVCFPLQGLLACMGVQCEILKMDFKFPNGEECNHVAIALGDDRILDPTASQFNHRGADFPDVYLGPMPEAFKQWTKKTRVRRKSATVNSYLS